MPYFFYRSSPAESVGNGCQPGSRSLRIGSAEFSSLRQNRRPQECTRAVSFQPLRAPLNRRSFSALPFSATIGYDAMMVSVADLRREYTLYGLSEASLEETPLAQFQLWFDQVVRAGLQDPNAMTLATADASGMPAARIVLLKGFDERGFVFFTNYLSAKGRQLVENPRATLVFFWPELERQVRVSGEVERTSREESEGYFRSRPRESQIGAHASQQGEVIPSRGGLESRMMAVTKAFEGKEVPLPEYWGGFRLSPHMAEFWQGRPSRLHDRIRYVKMPGGDWRIERLCP